MEKTIKFGGEKRSFLFSTYVTRILTDKYPGDIVKELDKAPLDTWMDIGRTCLEQGSDQTIPVKDYYLWWDDAPDEVKHEIREGIKLCTNFGGTDESKSDQFKALWESMNDEEKEACKKIVLAKQGSNGVGKSKAQVEAGTK